MTELKANLRILFVLVFEEMHVLRVEKSPFFSEHVKERGRENVKGYKNGFFRISTGYEPMAE